MDRIVNGLLAIVVITNGLSEHFKQSANAWISEFGIGKDLFFCGPKAALLSSGIPVEGIIDYVDPPNSGRFFHINQKKLHASQAMKTDYVYLAHDRFIPPPGFKALLENAIRSSFPDFGCVPVLNLNGSPALNDLRLRTSTLAVPLEHALMCNGRLACDARSSQASSQLAINGGQFFIRRELADMLSRPLRWVEMEDDVLSHDLQNHVGKWVTDTHLISLVSRQPLLSNIPLSVKLRYLFYRIFCNALASLLQIFVPAKRYISVGQCLSISRLDEIHTNGVCLVDPLHKSCSSEWLPSSLEKTMVRVRLRSGGRKWEQVIETKIGWELK